MLSPSSWLLSGTSSFFTRRLAELLKESQRKSKRVVDGDEEEDVEQEEEEEESQLPSTSFTVSSALEDEALSKAVSPLLSDHVTARAEADEEDEDGEKQLGPRVVVLDLEHHSDESERVLQALRAAAAAAAPAAVDSDEEDEEPEEEAPKRRILVIAVSSALCWNATYPSSRQKLDEERYTLRRCSLKYKRVKTLETLALSAQSPHVTPVVLAAGVLYGHEQDALHTLFRQAWMTDERHHPEQPLPIVGAGSNLLPTLHVQDLCSIVQHVATQSAEELEDGAVPSYMVAVDKATDSQAAVVEAISRAIGNGQTESVDANDERALLNEFGPLESLTADLRFKRKGVAALPISWVSEAGLVHNIDSIVQEYIRARDLRPVRIMLHGPPASGKSFYSALLAEKYVIPHLSIGKLVEEAAAGDGELGERVRAVREEAASKKGKKKKKGKKGQADPSRLDTELLTQIVKIKLASPTCRKKGFILDGYPRTAEEALSLFSAPLPPPASEDAPAEDAEEDEEEAGDDEEEAAAEAAEDDAPATSFPLDKQTAVDFVVSLEVSYDGAVERLKAIPEEEIVAGHNDESGFHRRWDEHTERNTINEDDMAVPSTPLQVAREFADVLEVAEADVQNTERAVELIEMFVERGGKPCNFHPTPEEQRETAEAEATARAEAEAAAAAEEQRLEEEERREREERRITNERRRQQLLQEQQALIDAHSLPLRKFLMKEVVPALVDGLLDVMQVEPEDPVDYLSEYLLRYNSNAP